MTPIATFTDVLSACEGQAFTKGHGTQNDFIVLADVEARLDISINYVAALCDRQQGIGADGLLRVAKAGALVTRGVIDELPKNIDANDWFMDYRNADGSIAEMCGNGVRVFAHYLCAAGLVTDTEFTVGSRAGARPVTVHSFTDSDADITVNMGLVKVGETSSAAINSVNYSGVAIDVGNPHLVCVVPNLSLEELQFIDFGDSIGFDKKIFPTGVNVELVVLGAANTATMRVFERGVGETRSCGTGIVATARGVLAYQGLSEGSVAVTVPGGTALATITAETSYLRGPSRLIAHGMLTKNWK